MDTDLVTRIEVQRPAVFCELAGGRLTLLQFDDVSDEDHDAALVTLQAVLSRGLKRHAEDIVGALAVRAEATPDPDRARVMGFVQDQLIRASSAEPIPQRDWYAGLADGRDASRYVHVAIAGQQVVVLEAPLGTLSDARSAGVAISEAFNQALDRIESDHALVSDEPTQPSEPDWGEIARQIERLRRGY